MQPEEITKIYGELHSTFDRAGRSIRDALQSLVDDTHIGYLALSYRVKTLDSVLEKSVRKQYSDPFKESTDFVGIRVIVYYIDDVDKIVALIGKEFKVLESENKADNLGVQELGYRSHHCIVQIPPSWLSAPNYRGLGECSVEIQVRTVLTHAWAEIEHKLRYKSKQQVPKELQRRLYLLSAKFEEADTQFKELRDEAEKYRSNVEEKVQSKPTFDTSLNLDLDTFEAFLKFHYPAYKESRGVATNVFEEAARNDLTFTDLAKLVDKFRPYEPLLTTTYGEELTGANTLSYALDVLGNLEKAALPDEGRKKMIYRLKAFGMK